MPSENRSLTKPIVLDDLLDDLSVEISLAMKSTGTRLCDLAKYGYSRTRILQISQFLRGVPADRPLGHVAALRLAEHVGVEVGFDVRRKSAS